MMDVQKIEELIRVLEGSPNEELCVQKGDYRVCIKKGAKPAPAPVKRQAASTTAASPAPGRSADQFVNAPMVGIFHTVDGVAQVGAAVSVGQVVGTIESMKLANDVISNVAGTVQEVLVEDGMPIEYGQPLLRVTA